METEINKQAQQTDVISMTAMISKTDSKQSPTKAGRIVRYLILKSSVAHLLNTSCVFQCEAILAQREEKSKRVSEK